MKKLYGVVVVLAFVATLGIGVTVERTALGIDPCFGPPSNGVYVQPYSWRLGFPFKTTIEQGIAVPVSVGACYNNMFPYPDDGSLQFAEAYLGTPIFYLNWVIFSLPLVALLYVVNKRRHHNQPANKGKSP